jgi:hypothetical protein
MTEKHGMTRTPEYKAWLNMRKRCSRPDLSNYHYWAGVAVCERWDRSFLAFYEDMGLRPSPKHSLDRIDNGRGYEPGNCRWATQKEQQNNRSYKRLLEHGGRKQTAAQWARELGVDPQTVRDRAARGAPLDQRLPHKNEGTVYCPQELIKLSRDGYPILQIMKRLNEAGVPSARGGKWHYPTTWKAVRSIQPS